MQLRPAIVLTSVLAVFGPCARATTYYVSTSGNDSNSGTQSAPFRHLSKGAAAATQPGDTVIVMDGTYDNEGQVAPNYVVTLYYSGTSGNPITFQAQHRGMAILDSMNTSTTTTCNGAYSYFNLYNASFIVIQGFVIQRGCNEGIHSNDSAHDIVIRQNVIQYIGNHANTTQIGEDGIYLNSSEYNFTFDSNTFHDIGRTSGQTQLHFDHGIYTHAATVTITNNTFYNMNAGWSIQLADGASNMLIANNTFAFPNTGDGETGQIMWWGGNTNVTVRNNIFYNPNTSAMTQYAATISGCVFDHNLVYPVSSVMDSSFPCSVTSNVLGSGYPQFVNASTSSPNFSTQSNGAGVDAGTNLSQVPYDCAGTARPQGSSTDIGAYEYISSTSTAPVISGVSASSVTANSAVINWTTNQAATSYTNYGTSSNYTSTTPTNSTMLTIHSVALSNLAASTTYHFQAGSTNSSGQSTLSSDSTFTTAAPPTVNSAQFVSQSPPPSTMTPGQSYQVSVTMSNTGTTTWTAAGNYRLGSQNPQDNTTWGTARVYLSPGDSIAPGQSKTFTFTVTAPSAAGSYAFQWRMVQELVQWFGDYTPSISIGVSSGDITTGLAARWKFTEGSGNYAYDSSGRGNTATLYSPTWWTSNYGVTNWFSGSNSYGSVKESSGLEMTSQLTVAFWLRPSQNAGLDPRVISKLYDWDVKLSGSNRYPQFSAGGQYAMLNYSLPLITWHHVVFTFSSGVVKGYVDGVQVAFSANTFTATTLANWAYGLYIAAYDSNFDNPYIGSLDDVRLYNRALSAADVAALYAALPRLN